MNAEVINKLQALKKPTIRLQHCSEKRVSKFGGLPVVDESNFQWPTFNGNPLAFLGQIDLEEMSEVMKNNWLPEKGCLLFFYDIIEQCSGYEDNDRLSWRVIYQKSQDSKAAYPADIDAESKINEVFLLGSESQRLPPHSEHIHFPTQEYEIAEKELQYLHDLKQAEFDSDAPFHQFGGYPTDPTFNSLKLEAHLALNGTRNYLSSDRLSLSEEGLAALVNPDSSIAVNEKQTMQNLKAGADDWALLLQIDSDTQVCNEFAFGDGDKLFFYVQKENALKKNFEDVWMFVQVIV